MAGVQLDELEKAQRSMRVSIFNSTMRVLTRQKVIILQGMFRVQPPETIDSLSTVEFGSESSGMMTGTEAGAIYVVQGVQGFFEFGWNNPYFGKRGYKKIAPVGFEVECNAIDGTNCVVSFVVTETAPQRTEAEIQLEKMKVDSALAEMERVVKGIEKMLMVYALKKDTKNAKLVEDEIAAKQRDMDQARARLHSLNLELEKKVKEDDPQFIQQELQKIKGKIEAAAKVKKGIDLMKDMYSSGSQKDPRQAVMVDQQLESKKREIEALHKFEQKLLDQLARVNAGGVTQPVNAQSLHGEEVPTSGGATSAAPSADTSASSNEPVRAKILFEVVPNSDTELALQAGDIVTVVDKSGAEWWEGEFDGKRGYFPAAYAELIQESTEVSKGEYTYPKATVITDYTPTAEGELALKVGETITVYGWDDAYWWEGSKSGTVGFFPCHCVQWIDTSADSTGAVNTSGDYYEDIDKKDDQPQAEPAPSHDTHHETPALHTPAETPQEPPQETPPKRNSFRKSYEPPKHFPAEPATSEVASLLANQEPPLPEPSAEPAYVLPPPVESIQELPPPPAEPLQVPAPAVFEPPPQEPAPVVAAVPRKLSQPPPPAIRHHEPQVVHHEPQVVQHEPQAALQSQPPPAQEQTPQPQPAPAKTATTPGPVATKNPVAVPQGVTTAMRRAPSGTALTGKPAAGQPRALPQPNTHRVTASTDTNLTTFKEGLRQRTSEFANIIEQYTAAAVSQHLDTISKLQDRVKELEALNTQVTKERDELKAILSADGQDPSKGSASKRSFWEEAARAVKK